MKYSAILLAASLFLTACGGSALKNADSMERYLTRYQNGKEENIEALVRSYENPDLNRDLRLKALEYIVESKDPFMWTLMDQKLKDPLSLSPDEIKVMIKVMADSRDPEFTPLLMRTYMIYMNTHMSYQNQILEALYATTGKEQLRNYLELYQRSKEAYLSLDANLNRTLGKFDDPTVVPLLMSIAQNPKNNIKIREEAMRMLSEKNTPELAKVLTTMLGEPENELMIRDFAFNVLEDDALDEKLLLSLTEFIQRNKEREHKMMETVIDVLGDYRNPAVIPTLLHIYRTGAYARDLKDQAVKALIDFNRIDLLEQMVETMSDKKDYYYWPLISDAVSALEAVELRQKMEEIAMRDHRLILGAVK